MSAPLFVGPGLVSRRLRVAREDVAWVRWILEAHDGLGSIHVERGGAITLVTTTELADALDRLIDDLAEELAIERAR